MIKYHFYWNHKYVYRRTTGPQSTVLIMLNKFKKIKIKQNKQKRENQSQLSTAHEPNQNNFDSVLPKTILLYKPNLSGTKDLYSFHGVSFGLIAGSSVLLLTETHKLRIGFSVLKAWYMIRVLDNIRGFKCWWNEKFD